MNILKQRGSATFVFFITSFLMAVAIFCIVVIYGSYVKNSYEMIEQRIQITYFNAKESKNKDEFDVNNKRLSDLKQQAYQSLESVPERWILEFFEMPRINIGYKNQKDDYTLSYESKETAENK